MEVSVGRYKFKLDSPERAATLAAREAWLDSPNTTPAEFLHLWDKKVPWFRPAVKAAGFSFLAYNSLQKHRRQDKLKQEHRSHARMRPVLDKLRSTPGPISRETVVGWITKLMLPAKAVAVTQFVGIEELDYGKAVAVKFFCTSNTADYIPKQRSDYKKMGVSVGDHQLWEVGKDREHAKKLYTQALARAEGMRYKRGPLPGRGVFAMPYDEARAIMMSVTSIEHSSSRPSTSKELGALYDR